MNTILRWFYVIFIFSVSITYGQRMDYADPQKYEVGGIVVTGAENLNKGVLISISGIRIGDKIDIPGNEISQAIKRLWEQRLFADVAIYVVKKNEGKVYLEIAVKEKSRISGYRLTGVRKGEKDEVKKHIPIRAGLILTETLRRNIINGISKYYKEKGFNNVQVNVLETRDTSIANTVFVEVRVNKGSKVKINEIAFDGNAEVPERRLRKAMKGTKEKVKFDLVEMLKVKKYRDTTKQFKFPRMLGNIAPSRAYDYMSQFVNLNIFKSSKFIESNYIEDKKALIDVYNDLGYRDAKIIYDTIYDVDSKNINVHIRVDEGNQYYFGNIEWQGNTKYPDSILTKILDIRPGDVFSQTILDERLFINPKGGDVSSLYLDDGHLFFNIKPIEKIGKGDSIHLEMQIYEGPQAIINKVYIAGNDKTNEKVIRRELTIYPGDYFSRGAIIRSQQRLAALGFFDPESTQIIPHPNAQNGTVDIEVRVVEKPSDQLELSAGFNPPTAERPGGVNGTLGLTFTNFSLRNMFKKKAWTPLPSGDGQRFSIRVQTNGQQFQSYNISFTEPWLGGRKPNSFSVNFFRTRINTLELASRDGGRFRRRISGSFITTGASIGWGTQLKWPDDFFTIQTSLNLEHYLLDNYTQNQFSFSTGRSTNLNLRLILSRNSVDQPIYPKRGSNVSFTFQATLPYSSLFNSRKNIDYSNPNLSDAERFRLVEYHKWKFKAEWYTPIVGNLVLRLAAKFGYLGTYRSDVGLSPFERFELGGDGLSNTQFFGKDIISLRGYDVLTPSEGSALYNKFTFELRYPISLSPQATVYALAFLEGGNFWERIKDYRPYDLRKSVGVGVRVYLPIFGLLGLDYGIGFDKQNTTGSNIFERFGRLSFILGFNPE